VPEADFTGEERFKLDTKARIVIPAPFRRELIAGDPEYTDKTNPRMRVVYGRHLEGHVECYTIEGFKDLSEMIRELDEGSDERIAMQYLYLTQSMEVTLDDTGRAVLGAKLREKLEVDKDDEVRVLGAGTTFQIWKAESFEPMLDVIDGWLKGKGERFNPKTTLAPIEKRRREDARRQRDGES